MGECLFLKLTMTVSRIYKYNAACENKIYRCTCKWVFTPVHVSGSFSSYFKCRLYVLYLRLKKVFTFTVIGTRTLQHHYKIGWNNPRYSDQSLKCLAWFITDSPVYEKVHAALTNSRLISGIKQASPLSQTSCLEGFHSVLNHFCPKMIAYSFAGMFCRWV